jgi:hypothetical protein
MDEPYDGMNLTIFNAEGALLDDHQLEVVRNSYHTQNLSQAHTLYEQLVYPQFEDGETRALTRIPMKKTSNGMKFIRCQLLLQLIFAGTVHGSQRMTLQRTVIDYRTKFWEHGQL